MYTIMSLISNSLRLGKDNSVAFLYSIYNIDDIIWPRINVLKLRTDIVLVLSFSVKTKRRKCYGIVISDHFY